MIENNFERYIGVLIFYILSINYAIFMSQILIYGQRVQKTIILFYLYLWFWYNNLLTC